MGSVLDPLHVHFPHLFASVVDFLVASIPHFFFFIFDPLTELLQPSVAMHKCYSVRQLTLHPSPNALSGLRLITY